MVPSSFGKLHPEISFWQSCKPALPNSRVFSAMPCHAMPCLELIHASNALVTRSTSMLFLCTPHSLLNLRCCAMLCCDSRPFPPPQRSRRILINFAKKRNQINFSFVWFRILVNSMCVQPKKSKCVRPQRTVCLYLCRCLVPVADCRLPGGLLCHSFIYMWRSHNSRIIISRSQGRRKPRLTSTLFGVLRAVWLNWQRRGRAFA